MRQNFTDPFELLHIIFFKQINYKTLRFSSKGNSFHINFNKFSQNY
jgi:hypothetical protein